MPQPSHVRRARAARMAPFAASDQYGGNRMAREKRSGLLAQAPATAIPNVCDQGVMSAFGAGNVIKKAMSETFDTRRYKLGEKE
jgi:hypothetical protein